MYQFLDDCEELRTGMFLRTLEAGNDKDWEPVIKKYSVLCGEDGYFVARTEQFNYEHCHLSRFSAQYTNFVR